MNAYAVDHRNQQRQEAAEVSRQLQREDHRRERHPHRPAEDGGHADERPEARALVRQIRGLESAKRAAHHEERREHAARRSRSERDDPDDRLDQQDAEHDVERDVAPQDRLDRVVADAEGLRKHEAAETDRQAAERRPPHPVERQALEEIFGRVDAARQQRGQRAGADAGDDTSEDHGGGQRGVVQRDREDRSGAEERPSQDRRDRACQRHRDHAARLPLEEQQFDRQKDSRQRRRERRRHAGGGAGDEQRLALGARQVTGLRDERSERAARHDDRAFRAEGTAGADRDGRRQRLEERDARRDAAAVDQDRLDGLGNAVAADAFRSVAGHEADDGRTDHRNEHDPGAQLVPGGARRVNAPALEEEQVRAERDEVQQADGDDGRQRADAERDGREQQNAAVGGEVAELVLVNGLCD